MTGKNILKTALSTFIALLVITFTRQMCNPNKAFWNSNSPAYSTGYVAQNDSTIKNRNIQFRIYDLTQKDSIIDTVKLKILAADISHSSQAQIQNYKSFFKLLARFAIEEMRNYRDSAFFSHRRNANGLNSTITAEADSLYYQFGFFQVKDFKKQYDSMFLDSPNPDSIPRERKKYVVGLENQLMKRWQGYVEKKYFILFNELY